MRKPVPIQTGALATPIALLMLCSVCAAATYRWVDKDGVVHYSDRPIPGATEVELPKAPMPGSVAPTAPTAPTAPASPAAPSFRYTQCAVTAPLADQVFMNVNSVGVSLSIEPGLRMDDRIELTLDGAPVTAWPPRSTSFFLNDVFRGSHAVMVHVRDSSGATLCSSAPVTFHVRQPSVLAPARR